MCVCLAEKREPCIQMVKNIRKETRRLSKTPAAILEVFKKKRIEKNIIAKSSTPEVWCV